MTQRYTAAGTAALAADLVLKLSDLLEDNPELGEYIQPIKEQAEQLAGFVFADASDKMSKAA